MGDKMGIRGKKRKRREEGGRGERGGEKTGLN